MDIFIVIAAYNEEKKIGIVIDDLLNEGYKNIIVVDDGSNDSTYNIVKNKGIIALRHIINRGQGAALRTGIDYAKKLNADIIVTFDADGQFLVKEIKKVIAPIKDNSVDIVLGSRFLGKTVNIPYLKKIVLKFGVIVVYLLYGIKITDSQSGFRALSKKASELINITSDRMEHAGEFFWEVMKHKIKYKEIPITVIYSKYTLAKGQSWLKSIELGIKMLLKRFFM